MVRCTAWTRDSRRGRCVQKELDEVLTLIRSCDRNCCSFLHVEKLPLFSHSACCSIKPSVWFQLQTCSACASQGALHALCGAACASCVPPMQAMLTMCAIMQMDGESDEDFVPNKKRGATSSKVSAGQNGIVKRNKSSLAEASSVFTPVSSCR